MAMQESKVKVIEIGYEEWKPAKEVEEALFREKEAQPYVFFKVKVPLRAWYEWHNDELKLHIEAYKGSKRLEV